MDYKQSMFEIQRGAMNRDASKKLGIKPFDAADYLKTEEDCTAAFPITSMTRNARVEVLMVMKAHRALGARPGLLPCWRREQFDTLKLHRATHPCRQRAFGVGQLQPRGLRPEPDSARRFSVSVSSRDCAAKKFWLCSSRARSSFLDENSTCCGGLPAGWIPRTGGHRC